MSERYQSPEEPEMERKGFYEFERFRPEEAFAQEQAAPFRAVAEIHEADVEDGRTRLTLECGHSYWAVPVVLHLVRKGWGEAFMLHCLPCYHDGIEAAGRMIGDRGPEGLE